MLEHGLQHPLRLNRARRVRFDTRLAQQNLGEPHAGGGIGLIARKAQPGLRFGGVQIGPRRPHHDWKRRPRRFQVGCVATRSQMTEHADEKNQQWNAVVAQSGHR